MSRNIPTQQHIKAMHLKEIFLAALHSGGISRAHLKQELHLSFPSVSALVDELLANHVLLETDTRETPDRGRPRTLLRVNPDALAIPVAVMTREGYHCSMYDCTANCLEEVFLPFALHGKAVLSKSGRWQPSLETLCKPLEHWSHQVSPIHRAKDLLLIVPGSASETGGLSSSALQMSAPNTFLPHLRQVTGWNVIVQNNSDCCAYSEKVCRPLGEDFIYIYIGRGVGAGIVRDGSVFQTHAARAGEIGHISVHYDGRACSCGRKGCLERYISTTAITQDARDAVDSTISTFEDVCAAYSDGNPEIAQLLREKALLLSVGIHNMLAMQPVSHVILGGKIQQLGPDFLALVQDFFPASGPNKTARCAAISYAGITSGAEPLGAVWNYLDHMMEIERMFSE